MKTVIKYLSAFSFSLICMLFVFPTHSSANASIYMDETESDDTEAEETIDISPKIGNGLNSIDYDATQRNAVIDVISYENLNVGETYTVTGLLYEVCSNESGEVTTLNTGITGSCTFSVDQTDSAIEISRREYVNSGYASVIYHMDSYGDIAGKTFVARETITLDKDTKLRIVDLSEDRYIHIPDFSFDFTDTSTGLHQTSPSSNTSLTVTIEYSNLVAGEEYSITGDILKSTSSRKPVWSSVTDGNNLPITVNKSFVATESSGTETIQISLDTSSYAGCSIAVATRVSKMGEKEVALYRTTSPYPILQQVRIVSFYTSLLCANSQSSTLTIVEDANIEATTHLHNFNSNETYDLTLTLIDGQTSSVIKDVDGNPLTYSASYKLTGNDRTITHIFENIDNTGLAGHTIVCQTTVKHNEIPFSQSSSMEPQNTTIYVPRIVNAAILQDGSAIQSISLVSTSPITGTINCEGLELDVAYSCSLSIMDETGNLLNRSSNSVVNKSVRSEGGYINEELSFPSIRLSQFYGMQLYPRFTLLRNGHKVATYDFPCLSVPSPTPTPGPTSTPTPSPEPAYEPAYSDYSVYVTRTGQCYHQSGCSYLRRGASEISRSEAVNRGLRPCSRCHPG